MSVEQPARSVRLFVAIELPGAWRSALAEVQRAQERLAPGYFRWVKPELMHLTLVFLGNVPAARLEEVSLAMRTAARAVSPFRLGLGRVGSFGSPRAPRVLWVEALQPEGRLQQLRAALGHELQAAGLSFDEKPLVPHITLGRGRRDALRGVRTAAAKAEAAAFRVEQVVLIESQLSPRGPSYHVRSVARV